VHFTLNDENRFSESISAVHLCGGKVLSINPKRASLEDLFSSAEKASNS
jgi:hypothetical protein